MPHDPHRGSAAQRLLAALDADPALIEPDDTAEIEVLPISDVESRLGELGLSAAIPAELRRMMAQSSTASMARRRFGWRQPAAALAGALAATIVLLLSGHALRDVKIADVANVSPVQNKAASTRELETIALTPPNSLPANSPATDSPHGAMASDWVLGLEELAEQNDPQAQFALGLLYAIGEGGVEKSYEQSVGWWKLADALGSSEAREALDLATVFRDQKPLPPKWANLVASIVRDRASFEKLSAKAIAARLSAMVNPPRLILKSTAPLGPDAPDMPVDRAWATVKDGRDVDALRAFAEKFHDSFYGVLALNRITRLLRFTSSFGIDTDTACRIASSYSLTTDDSRRTLRIWSLPSGRLMHKLSMPSPITHAVLLDGYIAVLSDQQVGLFDLETGLEKQSVPIQSPLNRSIQPLVASADGKKLLLVESEAAEWLLVEAPRPDGSISNSFGGVLLGLHKPAPAPVRVLDVGSGEIRSVMSNLLQVSSSKPNCYGESTKRRVFLESRP
jgi:hypothetical protein